MGLDDEDGERRSGHELTFERGYGAWDSTRQHWAARFGNRRLWDSPAPYHPRQGRMREEIHTGKGPQGYQRPDESIQEDANERLSRHGWLDAGNIQVGAKGGEITLTGTVDSRCSKRMAEDALETIRGVKDIHNRLRIAPR